MGNNSTATDIGGIKSCRQGCETETPWKIQTEIKKLPPGINGERERRVEEDRDNSGDCAVERVGGDSDGSDNKRYEDERKAERRKCRD